MLSDRTNIWAEKGQVVNSGERPMLSLLMWQLTVAGFPSLCGHDPINVGMTSPH